MSIDEGDDVKMNEEEQKVNQEGPHNDFLKIAIVGPSGSGKSTFIQNVVGVLNLQDVNQYAQKGEIKSTTCYEVHVKSYDIDDQKVEIRLWDCSSYHNQSYSSVKKVHQNLNKAFYRGALCVMIVVDLSQWELNVGQVDEWVKECYEHEAYQVVVIGTKLDQLLQPQQFSSMKLQSTETYKQDLKNADQLIGDCSEAQVVKNQLLEKGLQMYVGSCKEEIGEVFGFQDQFQRLIKRYSNKMMTSQKQKDDDKKFLEGYIAKINNDLIAVSSTEQMTLPNESKRRCTIF